MFDPGEKDKILSTRILQFSMKRHLVYRPGGDGLVNKALCPKNYWSRLAVRTRLTFLNRHEPCLGVEPSKDGAWRRHLIKPVAR